MRGFGSPTHVPICVACLARPAELNLGAQRGNFFFGGGRRQFPLSALQKFQGRKKSRLSNSEIFFENGTRIIHSYRRKYRSQKFIPEAPFSILKSGTLIGLLTSSRSRKTSFFEKHHLVPAENDAMKEARPSTSSSAGQLLRHSYRRKHRCEKSVPKASLFSGFSWCFSTK